MVAFNKRFSLWLRNAGLQIRIAGLLAISLLLGILVFLQRPAEESPYAASNLFVFFFGNIIIVALFVVIFLVGRNVVKLVFDRRRGALGSKLRLRLVLSFIGLILIPTALLFGISRGLLTRAMEGWFSGPVDKAIEGSVEIARGHLTFVKGSIEKRAALLSERIVAGNPEGVNEAFLENLRQNFNLYQIQIFGGKKKSLWEVNNANAAVEGFKAPIPDTRYVEQAINGRSIVVAEERGHHQFVRGYFPLNRAEEKKGALVITDLVGPEISSAMSMISQARKEYDQLKYFDPELRSGFIATLATVTMLILFSAIWAGFYIARELVGPIQALAEGTDAVAKGNYDFKIRAQGDDEIGFLVKRFNQMTSDLKRTSTEADKHRLFIESILSHLAVGVVAIDRSRRVTSINEAAAHILGIDQVSAVVGKDLSELVDASAMNTLSRILGEQGGMREVMLDILLHGRQHKVVVTAGALKGEGGAGQVLLFDDVTALAKAEQMAAWREVARRIAHEIKNPLTPIQLSAQRLQKLYGGEKGDGIVNECTQTIVEHVDSIKRLANEFSNFARMPTAELALTDLNNLVGEVVGEFQKENDKVQFVTSTGILPDLPLDREQIRRLLFNLIHNAVAAVIEHGGTPKVEVRTSFEGRKNHAILEVIDNGAGIPEELRGRIFEPYYTTKKGGTGLGLAIVSTIVADHHGTISVHGVQPHGARFVCEIPREVKETTQRKFG